MLVTVVDSVGDGLVCECGMPKARISKNCASCHTRKRWQKYYLEKETNRILCLCACGCGNPVKNKRHSFYEKKCSWRFKRQNKLPEIKKECLCGCGRLVRNNYKNFASKRCAIESKEKNMPIKYRDNEGFLTLVDRATIISDAIRGDRFAAKALRDLKFTRVYKHGVWLNL